jgi:hypothetical protein
MTNIQILQGECAVRGITEEVNTYAKWKQLGFKVKPGQHALFETQLWKHSKYKKKNKDTNEDEEKEGMYMTKAFLFGESQVEKLEVSK